MADMQQLAGSLLVGNVTIQVGIALNATQLFVQIMPAPVAH